MKHLQFRPLVKRSIFIDQNRLSFLPTGVFCIGKASLATEGNCCDAEGALSKPGWPGAFLTPRMFEQLTDLRCGEEDLNLLGSHTNTGGINISTKQRQLRQSCLFVINVQQIFFDIIWDRNAWIFISTTVRLRRGTEQWLGIYANTKPFLRILPRTMNARN